MSEPFLHRRYYSRFSFWIIGHLLKNKFYFLGSYVLIILSTAITVTIPIVIKFFFDEAINNPDLILLTSFSFLLLYFINYVISILTSAFSILYSEYTVRDVQEEFFESIHEKNMAFHDTSRAGNLLSMATSDSRQLSSIFMSVRFISIALLTMISVLISMFYLDPRLTLIYVISLPFTIITMIWYSKRIGPVSLERQKLYGLWQATLQENLAGIRALRTLSNRDREWQKYIKDLESVRGVLIRRSKISAGYAPTLVIYLVMGVIFIVGSYLVAIHQITTGTLIAFNSLVIITQQPNQQIRFSFVSGSMGIAGGQRAYGVITNQMKIAEGDKQIQIKGDINFNDVSFSYQNHGDNYTLRNISFDIKSGETIALIGHTGCGKTTITKLIQRLYEVSSGSILIDGNDIKSIELDTLRRQIGVIEQDVFLFSASIRENILFGFNDKIVNKNIEERMIEVAKGAQIHDFIMSLPDGYNTVIGERGITLSGGQRQRLAIARAFMINPPILILDDATSSVDAKTENQIQLAIRNLLSKRTSIVITHRLSTLLQANRIILMERGRIVDIGTHKELYKRREYYASIFKQFENLPILPKMEVN